MDWRKLQRQWEKHPSNDKWWAMYTAYLDSTEWSLKREKVLARDKRCRTCGDKYLLEVHHLPCAYSDLGRENLNDLITLCSGCHKAITVEIRGRRVAPPTGWRPALRNLFG